MSSSEQGNEGTAGSALHLGVGSGFRVEPGGNQAELGSWVHSSYANIPAVVEAETGSSQVPRLAWDTDWVQDQFG